MKMPGFTAESSLYRMSTQYNIDATKLFEARPNILPQTRITATGKKPIFNGLCKEWEDFTNDLFSRGDREDNQLNFEEGRWYWDFALHAVKSASKVCNVSEK